MTDNGESYDVWWWNKDEGNDKEQRKTKKKKKQDWPQPQMTWEYTYRDMYVQNKMSLVKVVRA